MMAELTHWLTVSQDYFHHLGWVGLLAYTGIIVAAQFFLAPLSPVAITGGFIFGMQEGLLSITAGTAAGAALNFLAARHVVRDKFAERIGRNAKFRSIDEALGEKGWRIIFLLRLCPIPFGFSNFAYGLTAIAFWPYFAATVVAIIPANIFFVWLGSTAQASLEAVLGNQRPRHPFEYALMGIGMVAGLAAMTSIGKTAKKALNKSA